MVHNSVVRLVCSNGFYNILHCRIHLKKNTKISINQGVFYTVKSSFGGSGGISTFLI